eukprot:Gb_00906 [translate_table: standard]
MEPLRNLVYYSCVSRASTILAQYNDGDDAELERVAVECLERIPPFHSRFTHTTRNRRFSFLMDSSFVYCAIVDEALGKVRVFAFLEQVRDEFKKLLKAKSLLNNGEESLQGSGLDDEFAPIFRCLVAPLVGIPQTEKSRMEEEARAHQEEAEPEVCSPTASAPLYEKTQPDSKAKKGKKSFCPLSPLIPKTTKHEKKKVRDQMTEVKEIIMENSGKALDKGQKLEVMVDGSNGGGSAMSLQRSASMRNKGQQLAQRMWWRNVRVVLLLDVIVCAILFAVWLCICHGFDCISE